jgi:prophage regulatory protein
MSEGQKNFRILKRPEVEATTGLSRSTIYALVDSQKFPAQIQLGPRSVGWLEHEVQAWLESRVLASRPSRKGGLNHA